MRSLLAFALLLFLMAAPRSAWADTFTLSASQDTDVRENGGGINNCGGCTSIVTRSHSTGAYRSLFQYDLSSIPTSHRVVSATMRVWISGASSSTITVHRVTQSWQEYVLTWANSGGVAHDATAAATFAAGTSGRYYDIDVTSLAQQWRSGTANNGVMFKLASGGNANVTFSSRENLTTSQRPQLVVVTEIVAPALLVVKSSSLVSDPLNGTTNPKAVPGAKVRYTVSASNSTEGTTDSGSTQFTDAVPAALKLCVSDLNGTGSGPLIFTNGATSSGLTYTYSSLASTTDSLAFSNNNGASFAYTPVADSSGCDANVTHVRVTPSGAFAGKTGATNPSVTLQMMMQVK